MPTSGAMVENKNGVLELTKLEYHKKWYFPIYFRNSVSGPNISNINANEPFCPGHLRVNIIQPSPFYSFFKQQYKERQTRQPKNNNHLNYQSFIYIYINYELLVPHPCEPLPLYKHKLVEPLEIIININFFALLMERKIEKLFEFIQKRYGYFWIEIINDSIFQSRKCLYFRIGNNILLFCFSYSYIYIYIYGLELVNK